MNLGLDLELPGRFSTIAGLTSQTKKKTLKSQDINPMKHYHYITHLRNPANDNSRML